jgi:hypothetical protein
MPASDAVDGYRAGIAMCQILLAIQTPRMSEFGTKQKCHRPLTTSAFGDKTDIQAAPDEVSD